MKKHKRECAAVVDRDDKSVCICAIPACDKPSPTYVPLCAAHRVMAQVKSVDVLVEGVVAEFKL